MNKFFIFSVLFHTVLGLFLLKEPQVKMTFKKKQRMNISYNSQSIGQTEETKEESETTVVEEPTKEIEEVESKTVEQQIQPQQPIQAPVVTKPKPKSKPKIEKKKKIVESKPSKINKSSETNVNKNFTLGADGIYTANSSEGIEFEFLKIVDPKFPMMAKKIGYKEIVTIKTKFLVDIDGVVKEIEILEGIEKYGFREETRKALSQWKFKPIIHDGKKIRVYFYKDFKFNTK